MNIYLNDLFLLVHFTEVCNSADDTKFFACNKDLGSLINILEYTSFSATDWFQNNYMKLNEDKCDLLIAAHKYESISPKFDETKSWQSNKQKLLRLQIDKTYCLMSKALCEMCPNTVFFLVRIFPHSE